MSPGHLTHIWGEVKQHDFQRVFDKDIPLVLTFHNSPTLVRIYGETPYKVGASFPETWLERQNPPLQFVTKEQDQAS